MPPSTTSPTIWWPGTRVHEVKGVRLPRYANRFGRHHMRVHAAKPARLLEGRGTCSIRRGCFEILSGEERMAAFNAVDSLKPRPRLSVLVCHAGKPHCSPAMLVLPIKAEFMAAQPLFCLTLSLFDDIFDVLQESARGVTLLHNNRAGPLRQAIQSLKKISHIDIGKITAHQQDVVLPDFRSSRASSPLHVAFES